MTLLEMISSEMLLTVHCHSRDYNVLFVITELLISAHKQKAVSDLTNLPYMETNCQFISIYGQFVTSQTASFSRADITNLLLSTVAYYIKH